MEPPVAMEPPATIPSLKPGAKINPSSLEVFLSDVGQIEKFLVLCVIQRLWANLTQSGNTPTLH